MNDVFASRHDIHFNSCKYIYHYTTLKVLLNILFGDRLKASKPEKTNDTVEAKPSIDIICKNGENPKVAYEIITHMLEYVQTMSFSTDRPDIPISSFDKDSDEYFTEKSHRGFADQKMFADYADNSQGVCIIFDKEKLITVIKSYYRATLLEAEEISYGGRIQPCKLPYEAIRELCLEKNDSQNINSMTSTRFLTVNFKYFKQKFYYKDECWKHESEFRLTLVSDSLDTLYIPGVVKCISGIVVGERISSVDLHSLQLEVEDIYRKGKSSEVIPIRKISFVTFGVFLNEV